MPDQPSSSSRRPSSILELAQLAQRDAYDLTKPLKHYLRLAEKHRAAARDALQREDLEAAFVEFAKAATLVLEKLPKHAEFKTLLNESQRANLDLNGRDILDNLSDIKPQLLDRYERWAAKHPAEAAMPRPATTAPPPTQNDGRAENERAQGQHAMEGEQCRRAAEDRRDADLRRADRDGQSSRRERPPQGQWEEDSRRWEQQRIETSQRDEERARSRQEEVERYRRDQADVSRASSFSRQTEVWPTSQPNVVATPSISRHSASPSSSATLNSASNYFPTPPSSGSLVSRPPQYPASLTPQGGQMGRPPSFHELTMPLEGPSRAEDSESDMETQRKAVQYPNSLRPQRTAAPTQPTGPQSISPTYPAPVTTTSPPPNDHVQYPRLMTHHQQRQGYSPSLHSMFTSPSAPSILPTSLLFDSTNQQPAAGSSFPSHPAPVYPTLPRPSSRPHETSTRSSHQPHQLVPDPRSIARVPPTPETPARRELKTVSLPREALPRFLSIARLNTALNKETCGLLLGRDKGTKFVVTTLLIPKQHSTSDTCTMDEEELVLAFTENRSLITLGWIHTHPSQSCFMSSVDLHTHSGFQCMLPESFAVVCAPKHQPNFGIFRLTDPPGLQTILSCQAKESFHPHAESLPIYTDADKGHVQMKDMTLEIVDLR
ncbi:hypothetical protein BDV98DRAFT_557700 [Pterulicium gracile]|uniref:MPN domain-containing protein n=1 Tax=Pterulicium gracile TaxID=1884261 RepID=A0A5C3QZH2_9AGAR|nr:hypothetical protein BDV98DRAFT_557700 [Pterula gracilis]